MTPNNSNEKREYHLAPHGGELCDLLVTPDLAEVLKTESETYLQSHLPAASFVTLSC